VGARERETGLDNLEGANGCHAVGVRESTIKVRPRSQWGALRALVLMIEVRLKACLASSSLLG